MESDDLHRKSLSNALNKPYSHMFYYRIPISENVHIESVKVELNKKKNRKYKNHNMYSSIKKTIGLYQFHIKNTVCLYFKY